MALKGFSNGASMIEIPPRNGAAKMLIGVPKEYSTH